MKKIKLLIAIFVLAATSVQAQLWRSPADSLRSNFYVEQCCAATLELCATRRPQCHIAPRLINFLTWADSTGRYQPSALADLVTQRYVSFTDTRRPALDFSGWPVSGEANAPVTVWVYYSGTCPTCKSNFKALHEAMTTGPLRGKAKMISKPLFTSDVNILLAAAGEMGRFDNVMLALAERQGRVDTTAIYSIAQSQMMDMNRLRTLARSPATRRRVEIAEAESKKEDVQYVPTYYINGRRYNNLLDVRWIIDAVEYEFENTRRR